MMHSEHNDDQYGLIIELRTQLEDLRIKLQRVQKSWSWRLMTPFRLLAETAIAQTLQRTRMNLLPIHQLERLTVADQISWAATGGDPQFLLRPEYPVLLHKAGWARIRFLIASEQKLELQLFVDYGRGFESDVVFNRQVEGMGRVEFFVYLPPNTRALRLDPSREDAQFKLGTVTLDRRVKPPNFLPPEDIAVNSILQDIHSMAYELKPLQQISRNFTKPLPWTSEGDDPNFLLKLQKTTLCNRGWHKLELCLDSSKRRNLSKFYFDTGNGFNENETVTLACQSGAKVIRLIWLEGDARAIRFDPMEAKGDFRISVLRIDEVSEEDARRIMLAHLHKSTSENESQSRQGTDNEMAEADARQPLHVLYKKYSDSFQMRPNEIQYSEWIASIEADSLPTTSEVYSALALMQNKPLISIIVPVYNTPAIYLRACLDSVLRQSYSHWELCIADDNSPNQHVRKILEEYERKDQRVRVVYREINGHISQASKSALAIATGDYVALLDHDDELAEHALYFIAMTLHENADAKIIYSDEDKIDAEGRRFDPHFKSDWNPDLFFSQNYVSHLGVYQRTLLLLIGGFRVGYEGSQDQDLLLRCLPHLNEGQISHVPRVLYHWRVAEGSTALHSREKNYTMAAGVKALRDHFSTQGIVGIEVDAGLAPNTYRVRWPIASPAPKVSLLIPTRDKKSITEIAVRSILDKTTYKNYEIIILDNGSIEPETISWFETVQLEDDRVRVLRYDRPFNYSAINNYGVLHAKGSIIGLINNDVEVISPNWLSEMVSHACRREIGCVGAKLYYGNGEIQHAGVILGLGGVAGHSHKHFPGNHPGYFHRLSLVQNISAVTGAALIVRKDVYIEAGGLNEVDLKIAFNDVDFCLKVQCIGYKNVWTPYAELYHHESISRGQDNTPDKVRRFSSEILYMKSKWGDKLRLDPYYNINLTKDREDFSMDI